MTNIIYNKNGIPFDIDALATDVNGKLDRDCLNYSNTGYSVMAGASMPSNTYEDLTLGASGATYTAPANGYFYFTTSSPVANSWIYMENTTAALAVQTMSTGFSNQNAYIPVTKNDVVSIYYSDVLPAIRFIYAQGSESEAQ